MKKAFMVCTLVLALGTPGLWAQGVGVVSGMATVGAASKMDVGPFGVSYRPDRSSPWELEFLVGYNAPPADASTIYTGNAEPSAKYNLITGTSLTGVVDHHFGGGPLFFDGLTWFWGTGVSGCLFFKNNSNPTLPNPGTGIAFDVALRLFPGLNWALFDSKIDFSFKVGPTVGVKVNYGSPGAEFGGNVGGALGIRYWL